MILNRGNIELNNDAIIKRCYDFLAKHPQKDTEGTYGKLEGRLATVTMADYLIENNLPELFPHNWIEFKPLIDIIREQFGAVNIKKSWFNVLPPGTFLYAHDHIRSKARGVLAYYPQILDNDSQLEILVGDDWIKPIIKTGDWISMSIHQVHRVPVNETEHNRISFSFNI